MNAVQRRFAEEYGLTASQVRRLITLHNAVAEEGVQECNTGYSSGEAERQFNDYAAHLGFDGVNYDPGLYPNLVKGDNRNIEIPH